MEIKTEFKPFIDTIIEDLREKGINIITNENTDKEWTRPLITYFDISLPMFFSKYFGPLAYNDVINSIYEKLGTEHYYSIKDDLDISLEYKREKLPITGEETEYMRIYITIYIVNIKIE